MSSAPDPCGCPDFAVSRRRLMGAGLGAAAMGALGGVFGDAFRQVAYGATPGGNVLVVLSLRGGADGLSIVVPRGTDHGLLAKARKDIVVPQEHLIGGDARFGLHPALAPLLPMGQQGRMAAVHAVGLPTPNRSHFESIELVEDAAPGSAERRGWINRLVGLVPGALPEHAVGLGSSLQPASLLGPSMTLGAGRLDDLRLPELGSSSARRAVAVERMYAGESGLLGQRMRSTVAAARRVERVAAATPDEAAYPATDLGRALADTATLIKADIGTKVVTVDYGNWDMHSDLGSTQRGRMQRQLAGFAEAVAAFFGDLGSHAGRVTVVTISEFGRRVQQNGSFGLDHGYGNAMLAMGAGVRGGAVHGRWPGLGSLADGDVPLGQDFRSVLWEVIGSRFPDLSRAQVFPQFQPTSVGLMG